MPGPAISPDGSHVAGTTTVTFTLRDKSQVMTITGHDEADPAQGKIAFSSPLARAMLGLSAGDFAEFGGEEEAIEIAAVTAA